MIDDGLDIGDIAVAWSDGRWRIGNVTGIIIDDMREPVEYRIFDLLAERVIITHAANTYSVHDHAPRVKQ